MKHLLKEIVTGALIGVLMSFVLCACGGKKETAVITVDENGVASWEAVPGAVKYGYVIADIDNTSLSEMYTTETSVQLPQGKAIHVYPIMEDGTSGEWICSAYYGEPSAWSNDPMVEDMLMAQGNISMDENGVVTWEPMEGAEKYVYELMDGNGAVVDVRETVETSVKIPQGFATAVYAVYADGTGSLRMSTGFFGEPIYNADAVRECWDDYVDDNYTLLWENVSKFELVGSIRQDSVKTLSDGSVSFEADAPGGVMRFTGKNIAIEEGTLTFYPGGSIYALDAIGRISAIRLNVSDYGDRSNQIIYTGGYTFTDATSVDDADELFCIWGLANTTGDYETKNGVLTSMMDFQPNFIALKTDISNVDAFSLSSLEVFYDETTYNTGLRAMDLYADFYGYYFEGEPYPVDREDYNSSQGIYDFYLLLQPDLKEEVTPFYTNNQDVLISRSIIDIYDTRYKVGNLKDAAGNVLNKETAILSKGCTVDVTVGDYTLPVKLPVYSLYADAQNMHELRPNTYPETVGDLETIVIPIAWADEAQNANAENMEMIKAEVGRVWEKNGVVDYSENLADATRFSLSEYYDIASYGNLNINSFVTEWYVAPYDFADMKNVTIRNTDMLSEVQDWLFTTYPDMDWTRFDKDENGYFDAVVLLNVGETGDEDVYIDSFAGGFYQWESDFDDKAGTPEKPAVNGFVCMNSRPLKSKVLIHEFAHVLGLVDYYDTTDYGIDAVGVFDMQSGSQGDWNPYSKYAVGWTQPQVVTDLSVGESVEFTIGSFAETGDTIIIPAADTKHDGPFSEYIMIDLFTDKGVNEYDAVSAGLEDAFGVRIYHVDARMEYHEETINDKAYPLAVMHTDNNYKENGMYHIELIQAGGDNTFTDLKNTRTNLCEEDLFKTGDVFSSEKYDEFLTDGLMNNNSEFGYKVEIVNVSEENAVICITRQ